MVAVVMEPRCLDTRRWNAVVSSMLGTKLYVDLTSDDDDRFAAGIAHVIEQITHARAEPLPEGVAAHPHEAGPGVLTAAGNIVQPLVEQWLPSQTVGVDEAVRPPVTAAPSLEPSGAPPSPPTAPATTGIALASLDVDEVCELLAHLRVGSVEPFRENQIDGRLLLHMTEADLQELGISMLLKRNALLADLRELAQQGVPDATMGIIRASVARHKQEAREREQLRTWIAQRGLSQSILTDAVVDLREKGLGDHDMGAVALLIKFNDALMEQKT
jgi:hypothetical protein